MEQDTLHVQPQEALPYDEGDILFPIDLLPKKSASHPMTPYQVLRMLPKDATPAQQDSAIQAWFQPGEIHYSNRPDTLHLPGHDAGRNLMNVNLPKYYKESFFANDTLLHAELRGGRYGVAGDPVPYSIRNDDIITGLLLGSFLLALISFANSMRFVSRQLKDFFYTSHDSHSLTETTSEIRFQFFLVLQTCLLMSVFFFLYVQQNVADTFVLESEYQLLGIIFGSFVAYIVGKTLLYTTVNNVFFGNKKNIQFLKSFLFITSVEGILLFPMVMVLAYFDLTAHSVAFYLIFVLIFIKILTFYKCWSIFFRANGVFLQIILYFCALEIVPLFFLWGTLVTIVNELKINF